MKKEVFKKAQLAEYLSVSISTINKMVREKTVPHFKINSLVFFDKQVIDEWIMEKNRLSVHSEEKVIMRKTRR